jgi:hypothetical protein
MDETSAAARLSIEATIRDYIEGWYEGDVDRMNRSLHDDLAKRMPVSSAAQEAADLREVTKPRMVHLTAAGGGGTPGAAYRIEVHDVSGRIASARVHSLEYLDYLHLVHTGAGWKIVNILFRAHD